MAGSDLKEAAVEVAARSGLELGVEEAMNSPLMQAGQVAAAVVVAALTAVVVAARTTRSHKAAETCPLVSASCPRLHPRPPHQVPQVQRLERNSQHLASSVRAHMLLLTVQTPLNQEANQFPSMNLVGRPSLAEPN